MKFYGLGLVVFLVLAGLVINFSPKKAATRRTETWLAQQLPPTVGDYSITESYKMSPDVYETLAPYGIVSHIYGNGTKQFDVTVIASDTAKSFHDPRVCFSSQGYDISQDTVKTIHTTVYNNLPITMLHAKGQGGGDQVSAYFYKGPKNMLLASPKRLTNAMFVTELLTTKSTEGIFYRFISMTPGTTDDDLVKFIDQYLNVAHPYSHGYL